ncbi:MAG: hypothetical protein GY784_06705 [Gammaproteobacteria bacterium]|nr:hypothetical protein [Gammaproteobacteria bacterium]
MKIKLLILVTLFAVNSYSHSAENRFGKTIWSCHSLYGEESILWLVEWGDKSYIKVFDERIPVKYTLSGLEKRWQWGLDKDNNYMYEIALGPDKEAEYFNFATSKDRAVQSQETYTCIK